MLDDLQIAGLHYVEEKRLVPKKRLLHDRLKTTGGGYIYVTDANWRQVLSWYENYVGWSSVPYMFVVSSKLLENWEKEIMSLHGPIMRKSFLSQVEALVWNHFDHGVEAVGFRVRVDELQAVAKGLSQKLNIALEIRETGRPF